MMLGQDVHHKTIGIVGFGRIGQAVARRAKGFGMRVVYSDAFQLPPEVEAETGAERLELDDLLAQADFVSIHTNLTPETRHLFGADGVPGDEADGGAGEHVARPGGRRGGAGRCARGRGDLRGGPRRVRARARGGDRACSRSRTWW